MLHLFELCQNVVLVLYDLKVTSFVNVNFSSFAELEWKYTYSTVGGLSGLLFI